MPKEAKVLILLLKGRTTKNIGRICEGVITVGTQAINIAIALYLSELPLCTALEVIPSYQ